jgi:endonuclease/exonuclease/phosphatase family metal-dependent hydrolase
MLDQMSLSVFSYNIHKGFSGGRKRYTLDQMRDAIRKLNPDLLFLQEVHGRHDRHQKNIENWPIGSQFEYLAEELWPHFSYGKNVVYGSGHHGNAILSKFPILHWENIDVSQNRFEKRGILHAVLETPPGTRHGPTQGSPLHVFCVHLGLLEGDRKKQLQQIMGRITATVGSEAPLIAAGDFNDWRENANRGLVDQLGLKEAFHQLYGSHARTFPSWLPAIRLDRVYFRGLEVLEAECLTSPPWNVLSDHTPLEVKFKLI